MPMNFSAAETAGEPSIDIRAESGDFDGNRGAMRLSGDIRIQRGEVVVRADEGYAYQGDERRYERFELEGAPATWRALDEEGEEVRGQATRILFSVPDNRIVLTGDVRMERGDLVVRADRGQAIQAGERYERVELDGSPASWTVTTADGQRVDGQSDRLIHDLVRQQVIMAGNAQVREPRGSFSGQRLVYDLRTQATEGEGGIHMIIDPELVEEASTSGPPD